MRASGCIVSPLAQLTKRGRVLHATGYVCPDERPGNHCLTQTSRDGFDAAVAAAKTADQVVVFVGLHGGAGSTETEGRDRQTLTLPGAQV